MNFEIFLLDFPWKIVLVFFQANIYIKLLENAKRTVIY